MHALLSTFNLGPGMRSTAEKLADQFATVHRNAKGFISETFIGDYTAGAYKCLSLWEPKEDIDAYREVARPQLEKALSDIAKGPPSRQVLRCMNRKSRYKVNWRGFPSPVGRLTFR